MINGIQVKRMDKVNPKVDKEFIVSCMQYSLGATPECKVNNWLEELKQLRWIVLDYELAEELIWGFHVLVTRKTKL